MMMNDKTAASLRQLSHGDGFTLSQLDTYRTPKADTRGFRGLLKGSKGVKRKEKYVKNIQLAEISEIIESQ